MLEDASNQALLDAWAEGNQSAAHVLVRRYMVRLTALARSRLSRKLARLVDPEDIVLSAWRSFFVGASDGRFHLVNDDLWPLLVTITLRKVSRQAVRHKAARRNAELDVSLSIDKRWRRIVSQDPSPEAAAILVEEVEAIMTQLSTFEREVMSHRLQGTGQAAIANALNCSERTVGRAMRNIRQRITQRKEQPPALKAELTDAGQITQATIGAGSIEMKVPQSDPQPSIPLLELEPTHNLNEFIMQEMVGAGGFGKVYRSIRKRDSQSVAIKFLRKHLWKDDRATRHFLQETKLASGLSHPHIVEHYGWGFSSQGALFVVMEWIKGSSMAELFREGIHIEDVLNCGIEIADALGAAHAAGFIHGDVTPGNVLRRSTGAFVLTDFGFSRRIGGEQLICCAGTPAFLAPEQICDQFGSIGPQTDVFGLGASLYFLATGRLPISARSVPEMLAQVISSKPVRPVCALNPKVPQSLSQLIAHCLQKHPTARPPLAEIRDTLRKIQNTH